MMVRYEGRYPAGQPAYDVAVGCEINGSDEQRAAAKADLVNFMTPAPVRDIEKWLVELSVITAGRGKEGLDAELMLTAYSSRLAQFPADVARDALLGRSWKWFPTWDELEKICRAKVGPRKHMLAALSKPEPDPEPQRREPTQEERDRIQAMVDEMFPLKPRAQREAAVNEVLKGKCMRDDV